MDFRFWPISQLGKLNVSMLLVVLVMFLLIIDFVRKRRPRNFPPGPQLFPLVGTIVDLRQPLHLEMQKVRPSWTFLLLIILYLFSDFCHLSKAKQRQLLVYKLYNNNVDDCWVYPLLPPPLPQELDSLIRRKFVPEYKGGNLHQSIKNMSACSSFFFSFYHFVLQLRNGLEGGKQIV